MTNKIDKFEGDYDFLSNFFRREVIYNNYTYQTLEHGYQAAKAIKPEEHNLVAEAFSPGRAKRLGRSLTLRPGWEDMKVDVMRNLLGAKFADPELRAMLIATGDAELIEGNNHGDTYWGVCKGKGLNMLGALLMELRRRLQNGQS